MKKLILSAAVALMLLPATIHAQTPVWQGKGRIAVSSDGNKHDSDDWSATAMTLALIASQGMQHDLSLYVYSDHVWGSGAWKPHGLSPYEHMRESALGGKERFGFDNTLFVCGVDNPEVAYNTMAAEINKSSEENPLIIIAAGPMQVVGEGLNRADVAKRQYVTVISHSWWNNEHSDWWSDDIDRPFPSVKELAGDKHSGWTFDEMVEAFENKEGGSTKFIQIVDQNGGDDYEGLVGPFARFEWLLTSEGLRNTKLREDWVWLYTRLLAHTHIPNGKFDVSDAGMVVYMLTGVEKTNLDMLREMMVSQIKVTE
ncbi:MAG: hypothetical protein R3Y39_06945 [Rikenellaceae bacterium]